MTTESKEIKRFNEIEKEIKKLKAKAIRLLGIELFTLTEIQIGKIQILRDERKKLVKKLYPTILI